MPNALRRTLVALCFALLASWAWLPLLQSPLHGAEIGQLALARSSSAALAPELASGHALAALDLRLSAAHGIPWLMRLESVGWLLLAAWALGRATRRLLVPWSGDELARAAGWATSMVFALHPLSIASAASVAARGDLMGLALGATSAWLYLRGRQERQPRTIAIAVLCCALAGFCSDLALGACVWLAGAEFLSAHRQRKWGTRFRSALGAAGAALVLALADTVVRTLAFGAVPAHAGIASWTSFESCGVVHSLALGFERLGTLFVPVNAHVAGGWGFALACALALATLQPILVAVRAAPRLWGRLLGVWAVALLAAEFLAPRRAVHPEHLANAATMAGSVAVMAMGLGLAAVALSGARRVVQPLIFAVGFAILGHANARAHLAAGREASELLAALGSPKEGARAVVIDAPREMLGVEVLGGSGNALANGVELWSSAEFARFAAAGEFDEARAASRLVVLRRAGERWTSGVLGPAADESGPTSWFREGRSPELDLDPLKSRALLVTAEAGADTSVAPIVAWSSSTSGGREVGRVVGSWSQLGESPQAVFDLASSVEWLATPRVRQVWSVEGWSLIGSAEFTSELPAPALELEPISALPGSVRFRSVGDAPFDAGDARRSWSLSIVLRASRRAITVAGKREGGGLGFPLDGAPLDPKPHWQLETLVEGRAIERLAWN